MVYGNIVVKNGLIVAPRDWEDDNMILAVETWLPKGKLYVNRKVWPILRDALKACLALNDGYKLRTIGCFAPRPKRVNGELSTHSHGIAVDINADTNPMGNPMKRDIPDTWIAIFEARGFRWGGRFPTADPQHFQYVKGY